MISFSFDEVRRWAEFSGDFNPIHFDPRSARAAGLDDLVVHGMLALLPIKSELARLAAADGAAGGRWMRFHALFRSPVPHAVGSDLHIKPGRRGGFDFRLMSAGGQAERFRGSYVPCDDPFGELPSAAGWLSAPRALSRDDASRFLEAYPDIREGWLLLDAVVFSDFMKTRLPIVAREAQAHLARVMETVDAVDCLFVQASHSVHMDMQALASPGPLPMACSALACGIAGLHVVANKDSVVGSVSLPVTLDGSPVMLIEIGLMAKPSFPNLPTTERHHANRPVPA